MVHVDVKKVGRIPDGGGWRVHGRGSDQHRAVDRSKTAGARRGYVYLHSAVDGFSRLAYTEPLGDETARTAIGFWTRARAFFTVHGITRITRVVTDNGACYRAGAFTRTLAGSRHQRTRPYTPRHNGKVCEYRCWWCTGWSDPGQSLTVVSSARSVDHVGASPQSVPAERS